VHLSKIGCSRQRRVTASAVAVIAALQATSRLADRALQVADHRAADL